MRSANIYREAPLPGSLGHKKWSGKRRRVALPTLPAAEKGSLAALGTDDERQLGLIAGLRDLREIARRVLGICGGFMRDRTFS